MRTDGLVKAACAIDALGLRLVQSLPWSGGATGISGVRATPVGRTAARVLRAIGAYFAWWEIDSRAFFLGQLIKLAFAVGIPLIILFFGLSLVADLVLRLIRAVTGRRQRCSERGM